MNMQKKYAHEIEHTNIEKYIAILLYWKPIQHSTTYSCIEKPIQHSTTRIQQHFNNIKRYSTSLTFGVAKERTPFRAPFSGDETSPSVELST